MKKSSQFVLAEEEKKQMYGYIASRRKTGDDHDVKTDILRTNIAISTSTGASLVAFVPRHYFYHHRCVASCICTSLFLPAPGRRYFYLRKNLAGLRRTVLHILQYISLFLPVPVSSIWGSLFLQPGGKHHISYDGHIIYYARRTDRSARICYNRDYSDSTPQGALNKTSSQEILLLAVVPTSSPAASHPQLSSNHKNLPQLKLSS